MRRKETGTLPATEIPSKRGKEATSFGLEQSTECFKATGRSCQKIIPELNSEIKMEGKGLGQRLLA